MSLRSKANGAKSQRSFADERSVHAAKVDTNDSHHNVSYWDRLHRFVSADFKIDASATQTNELLPCGGRRNSPTLEKHKPKLRQDSANQSHIAQLNPPQLWLVDSPIAFQQLTGQEHKT